MADILRKQGRTIGSSGGSGGGGLTEEEHDWLESLAAYEPNMHDINPNLLSDSADVDSAGIVLNYASGTHWVASGTNKIPVCGYKKIKVYNHNQYTYNRHRFQLVDGSFTADFAAVSGWSDWITIPENAVAFCTSSTASAYYSMYYSLSASES